VCGQREQANWFQSSRSLYCGRAGSIATPRVCTNKNRPIHAAKTRRFDPGRGAARGTFNRPPSSPKASATVAITAQGTNRASLKVRTDTDPVATQESPRGSGGACGGVKENLIIRPSVAIIVVRPRTAKKIIFIERGIILTSVITARGPAPGNPGNLKMLRSHFMGYM